MTTTVKVALLWIVIIILVFLLWSLFQTTKDTSEAITYTTFLERVDAGMVQNVVIHGTEVLGTTKPEAPGGRYQFHVTIPANYPYTYDTMRAHGVNIEIEASQDSPLMAALISWAPIIFLIALWMYFMRQLRRNAKAKETAEAEVSKP